MLAGTMTAGVGAAALLAGCGDDSTTAPSSTATRAAGTGAASAAAGGTSASSSPAAAKPRLGGEMKLGGIDKISDFDPHRSTLFTAIGQGLIMDQAIGLDKDFKLRPEL